MPHSEVRDAGVGKPEEGGDPRRWRALWIIVSAQLLVVLDASVVNIALPSAQSALDMSDSSRQWVVTAYSLTFGGFLLLGGRVADLKGRKKLFIAGLLGFAVSSLVGGFAVNEAMLLISRGAQGVSAAFLAPAALSLLTTMFTSDKERAKAFGIFGAAVGTGGVVGMILGGVLTEYLSWRWCLWFNVPVVLLILGPAMRGLSESKGARSSYDLPGALTATVGVGSLIYGISEAIEDGWLGTSTLAFSGAGVLILALFVWIESRAAQPMMPLRIVLNRVRGSGYLIVILIASGLYAYYLFLTYYLQLVQEYSALMTGLAFVPIGVGVLLGSLGTGQALSGLSARTVMIGGLLLSAAGFALTGTINPDTGFWTVLFPSQMLIGLGIGAALTTVMKITLDGVAPEESGVASALTNATREIGGAIGISALNVVAISVADGGRGEDAITDGYAAAFLAGGGLMLLATLLVAVAIRPRRTTEVQ
ncbi:MFS transporter [Streptomyces sp. NPDC020965]|uniref:MFS transporter n=1 Tax=Streptomyces sp. NPDC020965 TaxID=3365105 RepID=UPI0037BC6C1B